MTTVRIDLPWLAPVLSLNKRMHWSVRSRLTAGRRQDAGWCAKAAKLQPVRGSVMVVTMHWRPNVRRRRDSVNLQGDLKAAVDGLIDAGAAPDDSTEYVSTPEPVVHDPVKGRPGAMWLELEWKARQRYTTGE
jgi:hypothetical protein